MREELKAKLVQSGEWRRRNETRKEERGKRKEETRGGKSEEGVLTGRPKLVGPSSDERETLGLPQVSHVRDEIQC